MAERTLTPRELNRATLARQLLLERRRLSAPAVIERLVGVQAQWPSAPYVGLWTRSVDFRCEALERHLRAGRVVKATVMRETLHLVTRRDYAMLRAALSQSNHYDQSPHAARLAPLIRAFADGGSITNAEGLEYLEREHGLTGDEAHYAWHGARIRGHLLHHHETALWGARPQARFLAVEEPEAQDPLVARTEMLRRYLAAFGPATRQDIDQWSMMRMPQILPALAALEPLRRMRDDQGRELLDLARAPLPDPEILAPVRFLPKWDNVVLGYADRRRLLPDAYKKGVIARNGDVAQTFLVDGFVAGTWRFTKGRVVPALFRRLSAHERAEVGEEAERLQAFLTACTAAALV